MISDRFEIWIAGGSVLTGLAIVVVSYQTRTGHETGRGIRAYTLGFGPSFGPSFVVLAVFGALIATF